MFSSLYPFFPSLFMWLFNTRWSCCNDCHQSFLLSFFLLCFQDEWNHSGRNPTCFRPLRQQQKAENETHSSSLPPPSLPHLLPLLPESPFTNCGRGRWAKGGCGKSTGTALYAWRDSHFIQSADERTAATVTGCRSLVKRRRVCVCVHDRGRD